MKISVKNFNVNMDLGNNGITFDIYDNNKFQGDLRIGKGTVEFCKGKTKAGNGIKVSWKELIDFFKKNEKQKREKKKNSL